MNAVKLRGITSTLLIIIFIVVLFTGIGLTFAPSGRIARETSWAFLGFSKFKLLRLHTVTGYIMAGLVVFHLILNYKMFLAEIKALKH